MTAEALYRLPYEVLRQTSAKVRKIVPSAKMSPGVLERNRYYIDFADLERGAVEEDLRALCGALRLPEAARHELDRELERFGRVRFLGVGPTRGQMTYRIYLGFAGTEATTEQSAVAIDWQPARDDYVVKIYDELRAVPHYEELAILRHCLAPADKPGELTGKALDIYRLVTAILAQARGPLHLTLVREPGGGRRSVAFNYFQCEVATNAEIDHQLETLATVFDLPRESYRAWRRYTAELRLVDVAAGRAWNGEPFVTVYHGFLPQPPPYVPAGEAGGWRGVDGAVSTAGASEPEDAPLPGDDGGGGSSVYVLGTVGFHCSSPVRRDALARASGGDPEDPEQVARFLASNPWWAESLTWTLDIDRMPIYALVPKGPWAAAVWERLRPFLADPSKRLALPATLGGEVRLADGRRLPVIHPQVRGLCAWRLPKEGAQTEPRAPWGEALLRLAAELRNPGRSPSERAMNRTAVHLLSEQPPRFPSVADRMALDTISAKPSPICRPGSECWDVELGFFAPLRRLKRAHLVMSLTVDVSDVVPVILGVPRHWWQNRPS